MAMGLITRIVAIAPLMQIEFWVHDWTEAKNRMRLEHPEIEEYELFLYSEIPETLDLIDWKDILTACSGDRNKAINIVWYLENRGWL